MTFSPLWNTNGDILKNVGFWFGGGAIGFWGPLSSIVCAKKTHREIFQNNLFHVPQKKEGHIGLEQH